MIWYTDSKWEYVPASKVTPSKVTPTSTNNKNCDGYWNSVGDYVEPCIPSEQEDPGWQGR